MKFGFVKLSCDAGVPAADTAEKTKDVIMRESGVFCVSTAV